MAHNGDYILFLDESSPSYPNRLLLLGGAIVAREEYRKLIFKIRECKQLLGDPYIILHNTDITKTQNGFECMKEQSLRDRFWAKMSKSIDDTELKILVSYLNYYNYQRNYDSEMCRDAYELLFSSIMNNYIRFLISHNAQGSIIFEARQENQNKRIQDYYFHMLHYGTNIYKATTINDRITTVSFLAKEDNCNGLQLADIISNVFMRYINKWHVRTDIFKTLRAKIYDGGNNRKKIYGVVKIF